MTAATCSAVAVAPGATALVRMPSAACVRAVLFVSPATACSEAV